jgi:hypothetical protein
VIERCDQTCPRGRCQLPADHAEKGIMHRCDFVEWAVFDETGRRIVPGYPEKESA